MKRSAIVLFAACMLAWGCADKNKVPRGILPQPKMQAIMWDMIRGGEFLNSYVFSKDTIDRKAVESQAWYKKIFELHSTTKEEFEKSYRYYQQHPDAMLELLDSLGKKKYVRDSLKLIPVDTLDGKVADSLKSRVGDSLRKARPDSLRKKIIKSPGTIR